MVPVNQAVGLAMVLFAIGAAGVIRRRHLLVVLFGLQLMTQASALALVAFNRGWAGREIAAGEPANLEGQGFAFLVLGVSVVQLLVGMGLALLVVRRQKTANLDDLKALGG